MIKTYMAKQAEINPDWYVIDAEGQIVGRLANKLAMVLMGKHKPTYTPHVDGGDCVIVLNVEKVRFSGKPLTHPKSEYYTRKMDTKTYARYSGYPGGLKVVTAGDLLQSKPEEILREAVRRMLPKNKLGVRMLKKLKLCVGDQHPHQAQQPQSFPEHMQPT